MKDDLYYKRKLMLQRWNDFLDAIKYEINKKDWSTFFTINNFFILINAAFVFFIVSTTPHWMTHINVLFIVFSALKVDEKFYTPKADFETLYKNETEKMIKRGTVVSLNDNQVGRVVKVNRDQITIKTLKGE